MVEFLGKVDTNYLDMLRNAVQHEKDRSYGFLKLTPGESVLEVGCGPATDTLALAELVGASGRVVGVDFDPAMIAVAKERTQAAGLEDRVTHDVADATALPYLDNTFDACRSERVFQHVTNPAAVLAEMIRVAKPGGRLVVFDTDQESLAIDSLTPEIEKRLMRYRFDTMCTNPGSGRQLYRLFREAGLKDVSSEPRAMATLDLDFARIGATLDQLEAKALEAGVVTEEELERWRTGLEQASVRGTFFGNWTMMLAVGTKA